MLKTCTFSASFNGSYLTQCNSDNSFIKKKKKKLWKCRVIPYGATNIQPNPFQQYSITGVKM